MDTKQKLEQICYNLKNGPFSELKKYTFTARDDYFPLLRIEYGHPEKSKNVKIIFGFTLLLINEEHWEAMLAYELAYIIAYPESDYDCKGLKGDFVVDVIAAERGYKQDLIKTLEYLYEIGYPNKEVIEKRLENLRSLK